MKDDKKQAWEASASTWTRQADQPEDKFTILLDNVSALIRKIKSPGKVLDLGCGPGLLCQLLHALDFDVYGADLAEGMISSARNRMTGLIDRPEERFRLCGDGTIPFNDADFDVMSAIHLFPCVGIIGRMCIRYEVY